MAGCAEDLSPRAWPSSCATAPSWSTCASRTSATPAGSRTTRAHIELDRLTDEAGSIDRDRPVVFYCRTGSRSALAAQAFAAAGYDAHNLDGGLKAWVADGLPIEPADGHVA